jgi:protein-S-isoprenylcysteine O-methyltransferase Ste14
MILFQDSTISTLVIGFGIAFIGELIRLWGVNWAGSETRTTSGAGGTYLIIRGPFAYVRNPLYVGNVIIYLGLGIMSYAWFPYLQLVAVIFFMVQYFFIVKEEEGYLLQKYGKEYEDYINHVPAYFPRITPYKNPKIEQPDFRPRAGLRSEKRTFQAFIGISILLTAMWVIKTYT